MSTWHPTTEAAEQPTHEMVPIRTVQIRLNFDAAPPRRWKTRHLSQPRPTTLQHPHPNGPKHHQIASHMASTIWHTVEFSRNRRASPQDPSTRPRGFVVLNLTWLFGRISPPSRAAAAGSKPVPHTALGRTKRTGVRSRGGHPWGPATVVRSAVSVPPSRATSRTLRACCGRWQIAEQ